MQSILQINNCPQEDRHGGQYQSLKQEQTRHLPGSGSKAFQDTDLFTPGTCLHPETSGNSEEDAEQEERA